MDVQMPVMDGLDATRQIRSKFRSDQLPIVGLTANFRTSESQTYEDVGMNACLAKPVRMDGLKQSIYENVGCSIPGKKLKVVRDE